MEAEVDVKEVVTLIDLETELKEVQKEEETSSGDGESDTIIRESGDGHEQPLHDEEIPERDLQALDLEGKVKELQKDFKDVPRYLIRKVLQRPDVKEDMKAATSCLAKMNEDNGGKSDEDDDRKGRDGMVGGRGGWRGRGGGGRGGGGRSMERNNRGHQHNNRAVQGSGEGKSGGSRSVAAFRGGRGRWCDRGRGGWRNNWRVRGRGQSKDNSVEEKAANAKLVQDNSKVHQDKNKDCGDKCVQELDIDGTKAESNANAQDVTGKGKEGDLAKVIESNDGLNNNPTKHGRGKRNRNRRQRKQNKRGGGNDNEMCGSTESLNSTGSNQSTKSTGKEFQGEKGKKGQRQTDPRKRHDEREMPFDERRGYNNFMGVPHHQGGQYGGFMLPPPPPPGYLPYYSQYVPPPYHPYPSSSEQHPGMWMYRGRGRAMPRGRGGGPFQPGMSHPGFHDDAHHVISPPYEANQLIIRGVEKKCSRDNLMNYVETVTRDEVLEMTEIGNEDFLITLDKISDFNKAKEKVQNRPLEGSQVSIERVPVLLSIRVRGISKATTQDALKFYFSNHQIGGEVIHVQYAKGEETAVVHFNHPEALQKVLSQEHSLDDAILSVERYYPYMHLNHDALKDYTRKGDESDQTASSQAPIQPKQEPNSQGIRVAVDPEIMEFVRNTKHFIELSDSLREVGFGLEYKRGASTITVTEQHQTSADNHEVAIEIVTSMVGKFDKFDNNIDADSWTEVTKFLSKLREEWGRNNVIFKADSSCKKVKVICLKSEVDHYKGSLDEKISEIQENEKRKTYTKKTLNKNDIDEEQLVLLDKMAFVDELKIQLPDMEIEIDLDKTEMHIEGPKDQFIQAIEKIYQKVAKMSERDLNLSDNVIEMLSTEQGLERVKAELAKQKLQAVFSVDEALGKAFVVGCTNAHVEKAAEVIRGLTKEAKIKVEKENEGLLATKGWKAVCDDVRTRFKVYVRRNEWNETWFAGFKDDMAKAEARAQKFLDEKSSKTETYQFPAAITRRYLLENRMEDVREMEVQLKDFNVKIKAGIGDDEFVISGAKEGIKRAQDALHVLTTTIDTKILQVSQPGLKKFFNGGQGDRLVRSVEHDHQCTIEVEKKFPQGSPLRNAAASGNDVTSSDSSVQSDNSSDDEDEVSVYSSGTSISIGKSRISWKLGNIVQENADVLVSATIGQLAKVFYAAAPGLQQALGASSLGGGVTVTQGLNLPCRHVIHISCPEWSGGNGAAETNLATIVQDCLTKADQLGMGSIAFPIIGTGGLKFPHNVACRAMLNGAMQYCQLNPNSGITDVRFVVYAQDQQLLASFQNEFTAKAKQSTGLTSPLRRRIASVFSGRRTTHSQSSGSNTNVSIGGVTIEVVQGDLLQQTTDAIININHPSMVLANAGELSKAVSRAAGQGLQDECTRLGPQQAGTAVITRGYNLGVQHIVHMVPGSADKGHLQTCIENCINTADGSGFQSLSMPAFGTGGFGISDADSADVAFKALKSVCPALQSLQKIRIVIYQANMVQSFTQELQKHGFNQTVPVSPGPSASKKPTVAPRHQTRTMLSPSPQLQGLGGAKASAELRVYGKSAYSVGNAVKALEKGFADACVEQEIKDEAIIKLSSSQRLKLERSAAKLDVSINFHNPAGRVVIQGGAQDVMTIVNEVWKEIHERKEKEKNKKQAAVLSNTVRWHYTLHGQTQKFDKLSNAAIEKASSSKESRVTVTLRDERYVIDLTSKVGTGSSGGQQITVSRHAVGASTGSGNAGLPLNWDPMPVGHDGKERTAHLVPLANGSSEYQTVQRQFTSTGGRGSIIKIERVQNPTLYRTYMVKKEKMDRDNGGTNNERTLFHGTDGKNVKAINTQGFNRSFCGAHGTAYGNGVYFARDASYSMGYAPAGHYGSQRCMYFARVLVGRHAPGRSGLITPPPIDPSRPEILYDSVDGGGSIFVVFYDNQCYPEYLITFQ